MNAAPRPLGFLATAVEAARQTLLRLRHQRVVWFGLLLGAGLGALGFALGGAADPDRFGGRTLYCLLAWWLLANVLAPWLTIFLGVQAVHGPLEERTFQYLFLRPVGRVPLLLGAYAAVAAVGALLGAAGALLLFLGLAARGALWPDGLDWSLVTTFVPMLALASAAYAAVAVWFGTWFRRPLVWAAFFVVGLQMLTANLPVSAGLRRLTITDPLRRFVLDGVNPDARLARQLWPAERQFQPDLIGAPVADLLTCTAVCLLLAAWFYARAEYDSRVRE